MDRIKGVMLVVLVSIWLASISGAAAQTSEYRPEAPMQSAQRESLRDLKGVGVIIFVDSDSYIEGLEPMRVQTDVELRLRRGGVKVVPRDEAAMLPGRPTLHVNISVLKSSLLYVYSIGVQLHQQTVLQRSPSQEMMTPTWQTSMLAYVTSIKDPSPKLMETVGYLLDRFANDYLAVNSRQ